MFYLTRLTTGSTTSSAAAASWGLVLLWKLCSHPTDHCWPSHSWNRLPLACSARWAPGIGALAWWDSSAWCDPQVCSKHIAARADTLQQCNRQSCNTCRTYCCGRRVSWDKKLHGVPHPCIGSKWLQLLS